jgi:hypothetical protein
VRRDEEGCLCTSEFFVSRPSGALACTLAEPEQEPQPDLLPTFEMSRASALSEHPHSLTSELFLAAGG